MGKYIAEDFLKRLFGELSLEVISQQGLNRASIVRTSDRVAAYNLVTFLDGSSKFPEAHEAILKGEPIGQTFRGRGYDVDRAEDCCFLYPFPRKLREIVGGESGFVKGLSIVVRGIPYAEIVEIYSPHVLFPSEFEAVEGAVDKVRGRLDREFA